jgi:RNA polymerase sigma-70 factor (ECF subfamily)
MEDLTSIFESFRSGNREVFGVLYRYFYPKLREYGAIYCSDISLVENCIQDFFEKMLKHPERLDDVINFDSYIYRSVKHKVLTEIDKQKRRAVIRDIIEAPRLTDSIEHQLIQKESDELQIQWIRKQIEMLPPRQKEVVFLRFYEGFNYEKISKITELSNQVVRNYVARAIDRIRTIQRLGEM